jgi:hypothetical protein
VVRISRVFAVRDARRVSKSIKDVGKDGVGKR